MRIVSLWSKLQQLQGLLDTADLSPWEQQFVRDCTKRCPSGDTRHLSDAQVEKLDEIWEGHFA